MAINKNIVSLAAFMLSVLLLVATYHRSNLFPYTNGPSAGRESHKARYIFVDLGANSADSLEVFLKHENAKFKYDFPRPEWATHNQAEIYLFEANPYFNAALVQAKERYDSLGIKVHIFPSTVADVKDGTRTFFLDTVNTDHDFWGSSIHSHHPDSIKSKSNGTELSAINFSRWLLMNTLPRDFVVIKMDIEGAEYEIIPHIAEMNAGIVIDHLLVEWHPAVPEDFALGHAKVQAAEQKLKADGVNMPEYGSVS